MDQHDIDAYLQRLRLDAEPPSVDALFRLQRAHVERVPYETVWIHLGERWTTDRDEAMRRIAHDGRGGYCYHVNGGFSRLLEALGYDVTLHVGGVHGPDGPSVQEMTNHLVLGVSGLPSDTNPDGRWYLDAGLGDALHEPLPLVEGTYEQSGSRFALERTPGDVGDWHFVHDPAGAFTGMSFRAAPASMQQFAARHVELSTSSESKFVRVVTIQRRDATGADIVRGLQYQRVGLDPKPAVTYDQKDDWFGLLDEVFDLRFDGIDGARLDSLWERLRAKHEAWLARQSQA